MVVREIWQPEQRQAEQRRKNPKIGDATPPQQKTPPIARGRFLFQRVCTAP